MNNHDMYTDKVYIKENEFKNLPMFKPRLAAKMVLPEMVYSLTVIRVPFGWIYITRITEPNGAEEMKELFSSTFVSEIVVGRTNNGS